MFSPHGAMSVMRHWEFTLVLDNSGASVGISLGQSGTENKMQNNHLSDTIQRTLGKGKVSSLIKSILYELHTTTIKGFSLSYPPTLKHLL